VLSLATFGVAYVARPVGALILEHFGDRIGRQKVRVHPRADGSLDLPDQMPADLRHDRLVRTRLRYCADCCKAFGRRRTSGCQSLTLEHSPDHLRSFFTSWTLTGTQGGLILATW
jgi:hypothetical protein